MRSMLVALSVLCLAPYLAEAKGKGWTDNAPSVPNNQEDVAKTLPICRDKDGSPMQENNDEVVRWKESTRNQYHDRALVIGRLVSVIQQRSSHTHLDVDLGTAGAVGNADHIEIVYNREFGDFQNPQPGDIVAACGDYITATERSGGYQPSPMGAIVHWVHASNNPGKHAPGFVSIAGKLYGYAGDGAGQRPEMPRGDNYDGQGKYIADGLPWDKIRSFVNLPSFE